MSVVKSTLAAVVATLFGTSEKTISEKLSTEEYNQFTADANKAADRITALEGEKTAAETKATEATTRATTAEERVKTLEATLKEAETDREKYKGWFDGKNAEGRDKPAEDASNKAETPTGLSEYNAGALEHFRKGKG